MGKTSKPQDIYETIPSARHLKKKPAEPPAPPEAVRYVRDPVQQVPMDESNYAFHITYHNTGPGSQQAQNAQYATNTTIKTTNNNTAAAHSSTLPPGQRLPPLRGFSTRTLPSQGPLRSSGLKPYHVASGYDEERVPGLHSPGGYADGRMRHFAEEGSLVPVNYDPMQYASHPGMEEEGRGVGGKEEETVNKRRRRKSSSCSAPPWWGWLIIILVLCLLGAVSYFIFGQLLRESSNSTGKVPLTSVIDTTQSSRSTVTLKVLTSSTITTTSTKSTTTTTAQPTSKPPQNVNYHDDIQTTFIATEDTRSMRNGSERVRSAATTLPACLEDCLSRTEPCYGVDYNAQWFTCHLLTDPDYSLQPLRSTPKIHNHRRIFSVKGYCKEFMYYHQGRTFSSHVPYKTRHVDDLAACRAACLGPFGNGLLPNGSRCTAGAFDAATKTCLLTDVVYDPDTLAGLTSSVHFLLDGLKCVDPAAAACSKNFSPRPGRLPLDTDSSLRQDGVTSVPACAERCMTYQPLDANAPCRGFMFTYDTRVCILHTGPRRPTTEDAPGTDFYQLEPDKCVRCGYVMKTGKAGSGGLYQDVSSRSACRDRCSAWTDDHDDVCYGYDVRSSTSGDVGCHVFTDAGFNASSTPDVDLYVWDPACQKCNPTQFIVTGHTAPSGGTSDGRRSLTSCARACQSSITPPVGKRCHGFSHDRVSDICTHFYDVDYDVNNVGVRPSADHYRRMYSCSQPDVTGTCGAYTKTAETQATTSGHRQPWDIHTVALCQDRCNGYGAAANLTCHGLDFDQLTSSCVIYTDPGYGTVKAGPGMDHYRRQVC